MIKHTEQDIKDVAILHNYEYAELKAFLMVESSGNGDGIQFEPSVFAKWLNRLNVPHTFSQEVTASGKTIYYIKCKGFELRNGVDVQNKERLAYAIAWKMDERAAKLATSYGLGQILGENYALAGYENAQEMINSFNESEVNQLHAICSFLDKRGIRKYLQANDWYNVAKLYNGAGFIKEPDISKRYDTKLKEAYEKARKM